jgi:3-methyl-2-oxobutanoate hydroxymethyltransferase
LERKKVTIRDLMEMKKKSEKIVAISLHDYPTAAFAEMAGVDIVLVGDGSVGMTGLGYNNTIPVSMDEMIIACKAVVRGAKNPLVLGDMPFMSYQINTEQALQNASRFMKEAGVDAVKLEGGKEVCDKVKAICKAGIPVVGHIGLTPQSASLSSGYKIQGRSAANAKKILEDAIELEKSGAFAIVIEFATTESAKIITERLSIPTLSWGAGPHCDGIGLNVCDILGLGLGLAPSFAKNWANLYSSMLNAFESYRKEVKDGKFPEDQHCIHMKEEEYRNLKELKVK